MDLPTFEADRQALMTPFTLASSLDQHANWDVSFYELLVCDRPILRIEPKHQIVIQLAGSSTVAIWPPRRNVGKAKSSDNMYFLSMMDGNVDEGADEEAGQSDGLDKDKDITSPWLESVLALSAELRDTPTGDNKVRVLQKGM